MRNLQEKVEYIYNKFFSEAVKKNIEKATLWFSIIGFIVAFTPYLREKV